MIGSNSNAEPWHSVDLASLPEAPGMTCPDELRYLHWICANGYRGRGAVVELGSFLGRTTVAMASGLARSPHAGTRVFSVDTHAWDPWTLEHYRSVALDALSRTQRARLPREVVDPVAGASFRPLFDLFTAAVASNVHAVSADLDSFEWNGEPVEILFIDAAKSWTTLDRIVDQFFPCLVDDAIVIHQDYKHFFTWWLHPVTERMIADGLLEPAHNVYATPTQAYRFRRPACVDVGRYQRLAFDAARIEAGIEASRRRQDRRESITIAGARVLYLRDTGRDAESKDVFVAALEAGGYADDYGLWDFLGLRPADSVDLCDAVFAAAGRSCARGCRRFGARSVGIVLPGRDREIRLEIGSGLGAQPGIRSFVVQLCAPRNASLRVGTGSGPDRILAAGESMSLVVPIGAAAHVGANPSGANPSVANPSVTVRLASDARAEMTCVAPLGLR